MSGDCLKRAYEVAQEVAGADGKPYAWSDNVVRKLWEEGLIVGSPEPKRPRWAVNKASEWSWIVTRDGEFRATFFFKKEAESYAARQDAAGV